MVGAIYTARGDELYATLFSEGRVVHNEYCASNAKIKNFFLLCCILSSEEGLFMTNEEINKLSNILLQSLYDYHFANNGGSYVLPKAMVNADLNSKLAIEYLIEKEYALDSGQGSDNLVLAITPKGMDYIKNNK